MEQEMQSSMEIPDSEQEIWYKKREEMLSKFTHDFASGKYKWDATFQQVLHALINGKEPYEIIEILLRGRIEQQEKMQEFIKYHAFPQPFLTPLKP